MELLNAFEKFNKSFRSYSEGLLLRSFCRGSFAVLSLLKSSSEAFESLIKAKLKIHLSLFKALLELSKSSTPGKCGVNA